MTRNAGNMPENAVLLRFLVCSDVHIRSAEDERRGRLFSLLRLAAGMAGEDPAHQTLDAVFFVGDLTDDGTKEQYELFLETVTAATPDGTPFFAVLAKNHDNWEFGRASIKTGLSYWRDLTGQETDFHALLGGFHFIGLSTSDNDGEYYAEGQRDWLSSELKKAAKDAGKPIFVFHHEHVPDTVYGSFPEDGWAHPFFADILRQYPQIVHFSGHSHYPLNDPRSVVQTDFTAVGTGSLSYAELTVDGERKIHPEGYRDVAAGWLVEVLADGSLTLTGLDALTDTVLCRYVLPCPTAKAAFVRTPDEIRRAAVPPRFSDGQILVAEEDGRLVCTFPTAICGDGAPVTRYRLFGLDEKGTVLEEQTLLPPYWQAKPAGRVSLTLPLFRTAKALRITAENAFGQSAETVIFL